MTILDYEGQPAQETSDEALAKNLERKGWKRRPEAPAFDPATHSCMWDGKAWQVVADEPIKPERVPTAALLIVMQRRELTAQLDAILAALPEGQQREFDLYLKMPYTRRDHPLVAIVQQAFGWTDAEVDALFAEADAV
jgi:hypothetical protein